MARTTGPEAQFAEANARQATGDEAGAARGFRRVIAAAPLFPPAHNNLGVALYRQGDLAGAEAAWRQAVALAPEYLDAVGNLATVLRMRGALDEALALLRRTRGARVEAWNDVGAALHTAGRVADAVGCFEAAVAADPARAEAHANLGVALFALGRRAEAMEAARRAIGLKPGHVEAWVNLGSAHGAWEPDEAIACLRRAVALAPGNADAQHNLGLALLLTGQYPEGWQGFDAWSRTPQGLREQRELPGVPWDGGPLEGTLLLVCQQGYGDAIMFARYVARAAERARVVLEVPRALLRLFRGLAGPAELIVRGDALPDAAAHAPLQRLPMLLGLGPLPERVPYLSAAAGAWGPRVGALPGQRIGLVWAGNPALGRRAADAVDARRSVPFALLAPLLALPGVSFVSLQKGAAGGEGLVDWTDELVDFAETAALIMALDLVITVDTSVAHLAGALGRPVWLLNRFDTDWRWGLGRGDCDWYPTLHQFRQDRPGDWPTVIAQVVDALSPAADAGALDAAGHDAWRAGDRLSAARLFRRAVSLRKELADTQSNLGLALQGEGNLPGAEAAFRVAIAARNPHVPALVNLGRLLRGRGQAVEAEACLRAALAADPDQLVAMGNLANLLAADGRASEAIPLYERVVAMGRGGIEPLVNLGITLTGMQQPAAAISCLRQAIALAPDHVGAHLAYAEALLLDGQYREGFRDYAWRHRLPAAPGALPRATAIPVWDGRSAAGKTLLIQSEQGLGDCIMLARFATLAAARVRVVLHVPAAVVRVLQGLAGVAAVVPREAAPPTADLRCDMFDLPALLGVRLATLPAPRSYLSATPGPFAARLAALPGRKVGLAWAGNPGLRALSGADLDGRRSIPLARLAPLAGRASFVSLQTGAAGREPAPPGLVLHDWTAELADFADTARLIAGLDLVIAVDTAVAHLAGALGRPVWLLNRFDTDWRWGIGRSDSAWYPTLRQFRQPVWGDWDSAVAAVAAAL